MTARRVLAVTLAIGLGAGAASAQMAARPSIGPLAYDGPTVSSPGNSRMRLVFDPTRAAALTPEQYWDYADSYKRVLASLSLRMPVARAVPQARIAALTEIATRYPTVRVDSIDLAPLDTPRIAPHF